MLVPSKSPLNSSTQKQNIEGVYVYFNKNIIAIQKKIHEYNAKRKSLDFLIIDRKTSQIKVIDQLDVSKLTKRVFSAFLGIVNIKGYNFIVLCDEAKITTNIDKIMIFQVASLYFLSYLTDYELGQKPQRKQVFQQIRQLYEILKTGFYFSYKYNLTQSFQHQNLGIKNRFTWNIRFLKQLQKYRIQRQWCIPIIQGYVNSFNVFIEGTKIQYILISRRSNKKAGTRYFDRGTDQDGYVANFVHTQQIIKIDHYLISDAQIRGSVPIFFQQKGLRTLIKLTRGYELTHQVYLKHMKKLTDTFRRLFFVNLLSMGKRGQKVIIEELQKHFKQEANNPKVKYMYYDFHQAVHNGDYSSVDQGILKVKQMKINLGFYVYDSLKQQTLQEPEGIFRTNCLDCLDRTNFFQAKLALISLENIFKKFNVNTQNLLHAMNTSIDQNQLIKKFRHIWADNGDMISFHYTGTGSTHTDITRQGKRNFAGNFIHKYKTITRFYNQNFWDFHKMNLVDLLLDDKPNSSQTLRIPTLLEQRSSQFCQKSLLDIYIFSWKVPKKVPKSLSLFPTQPHLLVISLQQVSEVQKWNKIAKQAISKNYVLVGQKFSNNNLLKIFVKQDLKTNITNVQLTKVKFKSYYNQYMSTKCTIVIRFNYQSSKIVFCGCQLQYGREFTANRIKNLRDVHQYAFQQAQVGQKKSSSILQSDTIFLLGNMNTHISSQFKDQISKMKPKLSTSISLEERRQIQKMVQTDQFATQIRQSLLEYRQYEEEQIKFTPTYKTNGNTYDPQVSGWPDRIWYSTNNQIICNFYTTVQQLRQSHAPVIGGYQLQVHKINQEIREKILDEIIKRVSKNQCQNKINEDENQNLEQSSENLQIVESMKTPLNYVLKNL